MFMSPRAIAIEKQHYAALMATPARPHRVTVTTLAVDAVVATAWFTYGTLHHCPQWWMFSTVILLVAQVVWLLRLKK